MSRWICSVERLQRQRGGGDYYSTLYGSKLLLIYRGTMEGCDKHVCMYTHVGNAEIRTNIIGASFVSQRSAVMMGDARLPQGLVCMRDRQVAQRYRPDYVILVPSLVSISTPGPTEFQRDRRGPARSPTPHHDEWGPAALCTTA
jgi:hypothetical protein